MGFIAALGFRSFPQAAFLIMGNTTTFTQEIADKICEEIATSSKSLRTICKGKDMPAVRTVLSWLSEGDKTDAKEEFRRFLHQYTRAREQQADFLAEEMLEISEHTEEDHTAFTGINVIQRDKLRIETRKWIASKLKPKKYGDRLDLNHAGDISIKQITGMEIVSTPPKHEDKV